jgi:dolichol-phosphate mannosyltransferase
MRIFEAIKFVAYEVGEKTLIIIPTYNERENIEILLTQITAIVPGADVVVVDDRSPDGTVQVVKDFCRKNPGANVTVIEREGERGLGHAYRAGLRYGLDRGYEVLVTMDADMSHSPLHLPAMLMALEGHDVVIGSRYIWDGGTINWRIRRILLSWLANRFARFLLRLKGGDLTSGYRAYRRGILETIGPERVQSNGYSYLVEMLFRAQRNNARAAEVPIIFYDRTMGRSKISRREIYRGVLTLIRLRFSSAKKHDKK